MKDLRPGARPGLLHEDDGVSARDVLEAAPDALVLVDGAGNIALANEPAEQLFGYSRGELLGQAVEILLPTCYRDAHLRHRAAYTTDLRRRPVGGGPELFGLRKDGAEFPVEISLAPLASRRGTFVMIAVRDISARKRAEAEHRHLVRERALYAEISRLARQDTLTGLPNRVLLHDRLSLALASASRHGQKLGVVFLDLDRFKHVNDSLGHGTGDALLQSVAGRLTANVRRTDTVSRQGGDEFVILLSEVRRRDDLAMAAAKIMAAINAPHHVAGQELHVTASLGIAVYPDDGEEVETLIRHADIAMYHAKDHGRDNCQFFAPDMDARIAERRVLDESLRRALSCREFLLYYQPKIDLDTGTMMGAEALIRWRHPERGLVQPDGFIPMAEESGLIVPIGQWVLREACRQAREWQAAGLRPVPIAVNISALEFRSKGFLDGVRGILAETGLDPHLLELELTESVLMESVTSTAEMLRELKAMGLRLAVDDFGTGYSSLSYLMDFPIDALKVDRSFVREITAERDTSPIITAVIAMGKSLKHRVVAEGVETERQLAFLQQQRCEEGQGFHFSRPLPADRFAALLAA
ncbi:MAG: response regulator receiver modulated diguanylate cyclase/phosphodiesterase with sensor(s) [Acidobacteria bacterium]|nr:response regulator receiver modulated diguanylate cyclase/phosphodiesterase with sensor(s) [Acidobacteriota bacterium]